MSVVTTVLLVALGVGATIVVFYIFPSSTTSLVRYRLWPIRDELMDALFNDEFKDPTQPRELLDVLEVTIQAADELRPLRMLVLMSLAGGKVPPGDHVMFDLAKAHEVDKPRLAVLWQQYMSAVIKHVLFGSWSGFILAFVAISAAAVQTILKGNKRGDGSSRGTSVVEDVIQVVRRDIDVEPTLRVLAGRPTLKGLSVSV